MKTLFLIVSAFLLEIEIQFVSKKNHLKCFNESALIILQLILNNDYSLLLVLIMIVLMILLEIFFFKFYFI